MKKSDEMIALSTLYNKICELNPSVSANIADIFKEKSTELIRRGNISEQSVKDALYCLFPNEREKQIQEYKKQGREEAEPMYSSKTTSKKMHSLIDEILSNNTSYSSISSSRTYDPCSGGTCSRSSC
jgi:hypothetical protein